MNRDPTDNVVSRRVALRTALWTGIAGFASADVRPADQPTVLITSEDLQAITRGLQWLASRQMPDGGFGQRGTYARNVGICALSGLAFLSLDGLRGRFGQQALECARYLLGRAQSNGFIIEQEVCTHAPLYGHGFATLFLGQLYGEADNPQIRTCLKLATMWILQKQESNGAWRYTSDPDDGDVSVSTCQLMALHSARQAGISVPMDSIELGARFLCSCQNPDGGFRYRLIDPPVSLFPRTAAAVVALTLAGPRRESVVANGYHYLRTHTLPTTTPAGELAEYCYYGLFYAAQAAWLAGEKEWELWFPAVRDRLLQSQSASGAWHDNNFGEEYATAMALIVLQYPLARIPLLSIRTTSHENLAGKK